MRESHGCVLDARESEQRHSGCGRGWKEMLQDSVKGR